MVRRRRSLVAGLSIALVAGLLAMIPGTSAVLAAADAGDATVAIETPVPKVSAPPMVFPCNKKLAAPARTDAGWSLAKSMPVVERSEKSTTYQGPCNTRTMEIHQSAVNWMDPASGTWKLIDRRLVRTGSGRWKNASGPFSVELADEMDASSLATVAKDGWSIGFTLDGANPSKAVVSDDTVTYHNVLPGVDVHLEEEVTTDGLKESIVVNALPSGTGDLIFDFPLNLTGVTPTMAEDGSINFTAGGTTVATVAPAVAWDAEKAPVPGAIVPIAQTLVRSGAGWVLRLTVPASWARDTARALPITVDPTILVQNTSANDQDAFASSPDPGGVYRDWTWDGGRHEDWVGYDNYPVSQQWTYQNFDVSALNGKATIIGAQWRDYVISNKVGDPAWTDYFKISAVSNWPNNQWNINDIHWSTAGDQGVIGHYASPYAEGRQAPGGFAYVDLQPFVRFWTNGSWPNYGIQIDTAGHNNAVHFASNQEPAGLNPAILVSYNSAPYIPDQLNPASGWSDPTSPPPLSAHFSDMDGDNGNVDFEVTRPDGSTIFQPVGTINGGTPSFTPAVSAPGTYSWRVRAWDGLDVSPWSGSQTFTIGNNPPNIPDQLSPGDGFVDYKLDPLSARYSDPDTFSNPVKNLGTLQFAINGVGIFNVGGLANGSVGVCAVGTCIPSNLDPGTYSWQVRAIDANGAPSTNWSAWRGFAFHPDAEWMQDTFTGTNGNPWNSTNWTTSSGLILSGNQGAIPITTASKRATANGFSLDDSEVSLTYTFADRNAGSSLRITLRASGATGANQMPNGYRLDIPSGSDTVTVNRLVNGTVTPLGSFTYPRNTNPQRLRFRVEDSDLYARIWPAGTLEPTTWGIAVNDGANSNAAGTLQIAHAWQTSGRTVSIDDVTYSSELAPTSILATKIVTSGMDFVECTFQMDRPHKSHDVPGTVNVHVWGSCRKSNGDRANMPSMTLTAKLFLNDIQVDSRTKTFTNKWKFKNNAADPSCHSGTYEGYLMFSFQSPPGYAPSSAQGESYGPDTQVSC